MSESVNPRDWDAVTYTEVAAPQFRWAGPIIDRLGLTGDETVLDAGCGSGRVTAALLDRLPRGRVVALDASPSMVAAARTNLAPYGERVTVLEADLQQPLPVGDPVDAVFSGATFHWIPDHDALFRNLFAVTRPGGRLSAQCGGAGNATNVVRVLTRVGDGWPGPWNFATPEATEARLAAAGFVDVRAWLHPDPAHFDTRDELATFLRTAVLGAHLDRLPAEERDAFVDAVVDQLPDHTVDYVRLNLEGHRPA
jgi:trans-aconitate 2-methyltransferase